MPSIARIKRQTNFFALEIAFTATQALAIVPGCVLPPGARPVAIQSLGGATGGSSPTVDIGTMADGALFHNELDADTPGGIIALNGTGANVQLSVPTQIAARAGASAAGGGTHRCVLYYTMGGPPRGT